MRGVGLGDGGGYQGRQRSLPVNDTTHTMYSCLATGILRGVTDGVLKNISSRYFLLPCFDEFDFLLDQTPVRHPLIFVKTPSVTVPGCRIVLRNSYEIQVLLHKSNHAKSPFLPTGYISYLIQLCAIIVLTSIHCAELLSPVTDFSFLQDYIDIKR